MLEVLWEVLPAPREEGREPLPHVLVGAVVKARQGEHQRTKPTLATTRDDGPLLLLDRGS